MFTLKFHKLGRDNRLQELCLSCMSFDTVQFDNGAGYEIVAHPTMFKNTEDSVAVRVVNEQVTESEYSSCYVENDSGKTIGHYYAKSGRQ